MEIIGAKQVKLPSADVVVGTDIDGDDIILRLKAIPLGFHDRLFEDLPEPEPPIGETMRNTKGEVLYDDRGIPRVTKRTDDPDYLRAVKQTELARTIALIMACLEDGQVSLSTERDGLSALDYYLAVHDELRDWGLGYGAYMRLNDAASLMCGIGDKEVKQAEQLLAGRAEGNGSTEPSSTGASGSKRRSGASTAGKRSKRKSKRY